MERVSGKEVDSVECMIWWAIATAAAKERGIPLHALLHWNAVKRRQTDEEGHVRCAICNIWSCPDTPNTQISDAELCLDLKIALSLGGADNDPDNLQLLCGCCDRRKYPYNEEC
jgi:hypothetical protein